METEKCIVCLKKAEVYTGHLIEYVGQVFVKSILVRLARIVTVAVVALGYINLNLVYR